MLRLLLLPICLTLSMPHGFYYSDIRWYPNREHPGNYPRQYHHWGFGDDEGFPKHNHKNCHHESNNWDDSKSEESENNYDYYEQPSFDDFKRPWQKPRGRKPTNKPRTTEFPFGHSSHNHKRGRPWHHPWIPETAEKEEPYDPLTDPQNFPFGERIPPNKNDPYSTQAPFGHPWHNHPPGHPWHKPETWTTTQKPNMEKTTENWHPWYGFLWTEKPGRPLTTTEKSETTEKDKEIEKLPDINVDESKIQQKPEDIPLVLTTVVPSTTEKHTEEKTTSTEVEGSSTTQMNLVHETQKPLEEETTKIEIPMDTSTQESPIPDSVLPEVIETTPKVSDTTPAEVLTIPTDISGFQTESTSQQSFIFTPEDVVTTSRRPFLSQTKFPTIFPTDVPETINPFIPDLSRPMEVPINPDIFTTKRPFPQREIIYVSEPLPEVKDDKNNVIKKEPVVNIIPIISMDQGLKNGPPLVKLTPPVVFINHDRNDKVQVNIPVVPNDVLVLIPHEENKENLKATANEPVVVINHNFNVTEDQRAQDINFLKNILNKLNTSTNSIPLFDLDNLPSNVQVIEDKNDIEELKKKLNFDPKIEQTIKRGDGTTDIFNSILNDRKTTDVGKGISQFVQSGVFDDPKITDTVGKGIAQVAEAGVLGDSDVKKFNKDLLHVVQSDGTEDPKDIEEVVQDVLQVVNSGALKRANMDVGQIGIPENLMSIRDNIKSTILQELDMLYQNKKVKRSTTHEVRIKRQVPHVSEDVKKAIKDIFGSNSRDSLPILPPNSTPENNRDSLPIFTAQNTDCNPDFNLRMSYDDCGDYTSFIQNGKHTKEHLVQQINSGTYDIQNLLPPGHDPNTYPPEILEAIRQEIGDAINKGLVAHYTKVLEEENSASNKNAVNKYLRFKDITKDDTKEE